MGNRLKGKIAIITGAASGIGAAHARLFADEGAKVVATDIDTPRGEALVRRICDEGGDAIFLQHDVTSESSWQSVVDATVQIYGGSTTLGNNAGVASGNGAIVNMSSTLGMMGTVTCIAFHAAKGAVRVMSKAAAIEYADQGVRVNSIYPGMTDTPALDGMLPEEREMIRTSIPMKRIGRPEEIAHCSLFLCSDDASYVTGAEIVVDGGLRPG